jgi:hypothetical protein
MASIESLVIEKSHEKNGLIIISSDWNSLNIVNNIYKCVLGCTGLYCLECLVVGLDEARRLIRRCLAACNLQISSPGEDSQHKQKSNSHLRL